MKENRCQDHAQVSFLSILFVTIVNEKNTFCPDKILRKNIFSFSNSTVNSFTDVRQSTKQRACAN